jgi:hypothetical protein
MSCDSSSSSSSAPPPSLSDGSLGVATVAPRPFESEIDLTLERPNHKGAKEIVYEVEADPKDMPVFDIR